MRWRQLDRLFSFLSAILSVCFLCWPYSLLLISELKLSWIAISMTLLPFWCAYYINRCVQYVHMYICTCIRIHKHTWIKLRILLAKMNAFEQKYSDTHAHAHTQSIYNTYYISNKKHIFKFSRRYTPEIYILWVFVWMMERAATATKSQLPSTWLRVILNCEVVADY